MIGTSKLAQTTYLRMAAMTMALLLAGAKSYSQDNKTSGYKAPVRVEAAQEGRLKVSLDKDWHINAHRPLEDFLIPTVLGVESESGWTLEQVSYPKPKIEEFEFSEEPMAVYEGTFWIDYQVRRLGNNKEKKNLNLIFSFQACDDTRCLVPNSIYLSLPGQNVGGNGTKTQASSYVSLEAGRVLEKNVVSPSFFESLMDFDAGFFVSKFGLFLTLAGVYVLGLALTLTPCVYPLIPVTVGFFGGQAQGRMRRQIPLALFYSLGIALSYAAIGTFAALTGSMFGAALQNSWVLIGLSLLCIGLALNAFGLYEIRIPQPLMQLAGGSYRGVAGSFIMGLTMGIAAAPCVGAFVISLLAYVGQKGDVLLGFSLFFALGLGLATPFLILASFSGLMSKLPKSGAWMVYTKKLMGCLLFGAALYFIAPMVAEVWVAIIALIGLVWAIIYFGWYSGGTKSKSRGFQIFRGTVTLIFAFLAVETALTLAMHGADGTSDIQWKKYDQVFMDQARETETPVLIDFYADWCLPCKELDKFSFSDERVVAVSDLFTMIKADLTRADDPKTQALVDQYNIMGVPTIVILDKKGGEIEFLRLIGFENADDLLARMKKAL